MRVRRLPLSAAVLLLLAACDEPSSSTGPSAPASSAPATSSDRPLRLPALAAGAPCPTTPPKPWSGPGAVGGVLGAGPLYPVANYFTEGTVLRLSEQDRRPDGSYEKKVRWISAGYTGPVLVRAGRIDGPGSASVRFSYRGEERDGGQYDELTLPDNDIPATTVVSGPGCYAYQVDGTTFSTTIVFQAK